jgi:membrane associated rhomboid family serine protease
MILIAINVLVFAYQSSLPLPEQQQFVFTYGLVPANVAAALSGQAPLLPALLPIFTHMFLHANWMHIIGNMWFLWIFGGDIEDRFGHFTYIGFYLLCGLVSGLTELTFLWGAHIPLIGASGAISGIMGAFLLLYPTSRILTGLFFVWVRVQIPAFVFTGIWFLLQFASGLDSLNRRGPRVADTGGVAWWAHVGGFVCGFLLAIPKKLQGPGPAYYRPEDEYEEPLAPPRPWRDR